MSQHILNQFWFAFYCFGITFEHYAIASSEYNEIYASLSFCLFLSVAGPACLVL